MPDVRQRVSRPSRVKGQPGDACREPFDLPACRSEQCDGSNELQGGSDLKGRNVRYSRPRGEVAGRQMSAICRR